MIPVEMCMPAPEAHLPCCHDSPGVWNDMLIADYVTGTSATDVFLPEMPLPPTSLTVQTFALAIRFTVGLPGSFTEGASIQLFEHTASTPFSAAVLVQQAFSNVLIIPKRDTVTRYYWVRVKARDGGLSTTFPATVGVTGVSELVTTDDIANNAATEVMQQSVTNASALVPNGGTVNFYGIQPGARTFPFKGVFTFTADLNRSGTGNLTAYPLVRIVGGATLATGEDFVVTTTSQRVTMQISLDVSIGTAVSFAVDVENSGPALDTITAMNLTGMLELIKK